MPSMKKVFDCGHKAFGQFCHLCEQLAAGELEEANGKYRRPRDAEPTRGKRSKARAAVKADRIGRAARVKRGD